MKDIQNDCGLSFWLDVPTRIKYSTLYELAQNFVAAPASQASSEHVFSLCGDLTDRKMNRASKNLGKKRVFLKMNKIDM
jgi:hypothetical protein